MSNGREFQRMDAATGNERHPTVDRRKDGTRSDCDDDDCSRLKTQGTTDKLLIMNKMFALNCEI